MNIQGDMVTKVQKWGNSLGVRLPRSVADDARIQAGTDVDVAVRDGAVILRPVRKKRLRLKDLLAGITPENSHPHTDWGPPVGKEVW